MKKEIINQVNQRFDTLVHISNSKIHETKQDLLLQIDHFRSYQSSLSNEPNSIDIKPASACVNNSEQR